MHSKSVMTAIAQQHPEIAASLTKSSGQAKPKDTATRLEQRFNRVLIPLGWQCGECRRPCHDARSRANTGGTVARSNALVMWREQPVMTVWMGWKWDAQGWSDEQIRQFVEQQQEVRV